ncbi:hypothetical protein POL25_24140 [Nannocystis sp. bb15-2]|uniref:Uncharacterized protein n=2 Tax=Nannocystis bainbridge TaxID=2995303 RepID=A0ABT5E2B9_9BACT|nr:hypothetical protein [Nannocystis bainbridge]
MRLSTCLLALLLAACGRTEPQGPRSATAPAGAPAPTDAADPAAPPAPVVPAAPATPDERRVLAWLDPDSPAVAYMRLPADLEPEALGELFALPPRALALLRAPLSLESGLAALVGPAAPPPEQWLARDLVVMQPVLARGPYLVRRLLAPRADVEAWLRSGGMQVDTVEGLAVWTPGQSAPEAPVDGAPGLAPSLVFPWRLVFLADDLVGAFSLTEMGNGLGPLTAARDLPPSDLTRMIGEVVAADPALLLELYVQGAMLHFDLSDDVGVAKLSLRRLVEADGARSLPRHDAAGIDGEVILQPLGDVADAAAALEARAPAGAATDVLRDLYKAVAYSQDGPVVRGRLQLAADDLAPLRRGGGR